MEMGLEAIAAPTRGKGLGMVAGVLAGYWWGQNGGEGLGLPESKRGRGGGHGGKGGLRSSWSSSEWTGRELGERRGDR